MKNQFGQKYFQDFCVIYLPLLDTSEINHGKGFVTSRQQPCAYMNIPAFYLAASKGCCLAS